MIRDHRSSTVNGSDMAMLRELNIKSTYNAIKTGRDTREKIQAFNRITHTLQNIALRHQPNLE